METRQIILVKIHQQTQLNLHRLVGECHEFLRDQEFVAIHKYNKFQWKSKIKKIILEKNKDDLIKMSQKYKKINLNYETEPTTQYHILHELNVEDARMLFKIRSNMVPSIQMNFPNDKNCTSNMWVCVGCKVCLDTQTHVTLCKSYESTRTGLDLSQERDRV